MSGDILIGEHNARGAFCPVTSYPTWVIVPNLVALGQAVWAFVGVPQTETPGMGA